MSTSKNDQYPEWLASTLASDATGGKGVLANWITAILPDSVVVGPAFVVLASQDDNQAVRRVVANPPPLGCLLVIAGQNTSRTATIGGLMALEIQKLGVVGLVTDGLVRDSQEIRNLKFPVWCRGVTPIASNKSNPGVIGEPVTIGGAFVKEGDLIIADADGVVIWPKEEIVQLLEKAKAKFDSDLSRYQKLIDSGKN